MNTNEQTGPGRKKQKVSFKEDLKTLMYAFGDVKYPDAESLELLEEYMLNFVNLMVEKGIKRRRRRDSLNPKLSKEDLLYVIKSDPKWMARIAYIMELKEEIKEIQAKKKGEIKEIKEEKKEKT